MRSSQNPWVTLWLTICTRKQLHRRRCQELKNLPELPSFPNTIHTTRIAILNPSFMLARPAERCEANKEAPLPRLILHTCLPGSLFSGWPIYQCKCTSHPLCIFRNSEFIALLSSSGRLVIPSAIAKFSTLPLHSSLRLSRPAINQRHSRITIIDLT